MRRPVLLATISLLAMSIAGQAFAEDVNLWVRTSSAAVVQGLADKFNAEHEDHTVFNLAVSAA